MFPRASIAAILAGTNFRRVATAAVAREKSSRGLDSSKQITNSIGMKLTLVPSRSEFAMGGNEVGRGRPPPVEDKAVGWDHVETRL